MIAEDRDIWKVTASAATHARKKVRVTAVLRTYNGYLKVLKK